MGASAVEKLLDIWGGMVISSSVCIGDKLGLYAALDQHGPTTAEQFAEQTQLNQRYITEWLQGQAAAEIVQYDSKSQLFKLPEEMAELLADETKPSFMGGIFDQMSSIAKALKLLPQCFKDGSGFGFDQLGAHGSHVQQRFFESWYRNTLVSEVLPVLSDNIIEKLEQGAKVADVGCGSGIALLVLASKFPKSEFYGYEISQHALTLASANKTKEGLNNISFFDANHSPLPEDHSFDLIMSFDCIHDMTNPQAVIQSIYNSLKNDGTWFVADINVQDTFEKNLSSNPLAKYFYACSLACCLPSGLSEPGGAGLGTLGFGEKKAEEMAVKAGFEFFKRHDFNNPFNAYYEVRP